MAQHLRRWMGQVNNLLSDDVNKDELARLIDGFTDDEVDYVIRIATSYPLLRKVVHSPKVPSKNHPFSGESWLPGKISRVGSGEPRGRSAESDHGRLSARLDWWCPGGVIIMIMIVWLCSVSCIVNMVSYLFLCLQKEGTLCSTSRAMLWDKLVKGQYV